MKTKHTNNENETCLECGKLWDSEYHASDQCVNDVTFEFMKDIQDEERGLKDE